MTYGLSGSEIIGTRGLHVQALRGVLHLQSYVVLDEKQTTDTLIPDIKNGL